MRILIISQYYAPEPETIPVEFAKAMARRGHKVTVITGFPNYPAGRIFPGYRQRIWQREILDGVTVLRLPLFPDRSLSPLRRILCYLSFVLSTAVFGPIFCGPVDIIWTYHPFVLGLSAWWIGIFRKAPFIVGIQDMYPESLSATGLGDSAFLMEAVTAIAGFIYKHAAAVTVISPGFKRNLMSKGVPADKITFIPNWGDEKIYSPLKSDKRLAGKFGMDNKFNIVYGGNFGPPQGLHNIIETAQLLSDMPAVQFVLIGDGLEKKKVEELIAAKKIRNVRLLPRQAESSMPYFYALADALLVHLTDNPIFEITVPSKTQAYLACGRPILMSAKGDAADMVLAAGAGLAAKPMDPSSLADAVRKIYSMPARDREAMGAAARAYFLKNLTTDTIIEKYDDLFYSIAPQRKGTDGDTQGRRAAISQ